MLRSGNWIFQLCKSFHVHISSILRMAPYRLTPVQFSSVQFSHSVMAKSLQPHRLQHTSLPITKSWSLLKLMSIELVTPSNHLIFCHPLLLLPSIFPSIRVFFPNESVLHIRWSKYWSFSFNISPSNEYSGLISFRIDWFDLLAVQGRSCWLFRPSWARRCVAWASSGRDCRSIPD